MSRIIKAAVELSYKSIYSGQILALRTCTTASTASSSSAKAAADVPGLSKNTVEVPSVEVGFPGASKGGVYKNPEYFSYHNASYYEAEVEMMKYRLPQPSNKSNKK